MKIQGHTFVVTGGASGLGEGTTKMIVEKGGNVAIFDLNEERGQTLVKALGKQVGPLDHTRLPVSPLPPAIVCLTPRPPRHAGGIL